MLYNECACSVACECQKVCGIMSERTKFHRYVVKHERKANTLNTLNYP